MYRERFSSFSEINQLINTQIHFHKLFQLLNFFNNLWEIEIFKYNSSEL